MCSIRENVFNFVTCIGALKRVFYRTSWQTVHVKANEARKTPVDVYATVPLNSLVREVAAWAGRSKVLKKKKKKKNELQEQIRLAEQVTGSGNATDFYLEGLQFESHANYRIIWHLLRFRSILRQNVVNYLRSGHNLFLRSRFSKSQVVTLKFTLMLNSFCWWHVVIKFI